MSGIPKIPSAVRHRLRIRRHWRYGHPREQYNVNRFSDRSVVAQLGHVVDALLDQVGLADVVADAETVPGRGEGVVGN